MQNDRAVQDNQKLIEFWDRAFSMPEEQKDSIQDQQEEDWKELAPSEKLFRAACSLGRRKRVLDYGCGSGWAAIIAAKSGCPDVTAADAAPAAVQEDGKSYSYTDKGSYVVVYDPIRNRNWNLVTEFKTDLGVANGEATDRDILAALVEAEAGSTGLIGMEAVALTVLNRTIDRYFPSEVRYVVYQECNSSHVPGHSVVRYPVSDPWLNMRLKGTFYNKELAYKAVDEAYRVFNAFVKNGEDRVIPGFNDGKDMNFKYFMTPAAFKAAGLRCESYTWNNMTFFVDWPL